VPPAPAPQSRPRAGGGGGRQLGATRRTGSRPAAARQGMAAPKKLAPQKCPLDHDTGESDSVPREHFAGRHRCTFEWLKTKLSWLTNEMSPQLATMPSDGAGQQGWRCDVCRKDGFDPCTMYACSDDLDDPHYCCTGCYPHPAEDSRCVDEVRCCDVEHTVSSERPEGVAEPRPAKRPKLLGEGGGPGTVTDERPGPRQLQGGPHLALDSRARGPAAARSADAGSAPAPGDSVDRGTHDDLVWVSAGTPSHACDVDWAWRRMPLPPSGLPDSGRAKPAPSASGYWCPWPVIHRVRVTAPAAGAGFSGSGIGGEGSEETVSIWAPHASRSGTPGSGVRRNFQARIAKVREGKVRNGVV
jgi:hypothetical protein